MASSPDPTDGTTGVSAPLLQRTPGDTAKWHDVYFGTNPTPGPAEFILRQESNVYSYAANLLADTTYYWRIDEVEPDGTTIHTGNVWSFTTAPSTAWNASPADGARFIDLDAEFSWSAGVNTITHDVYFGTDGTAVAAGTGGTFKGNQPDTTFVPGTLARTTTYYWRIDEVEADGITKHTGPVWSFMARPPSTMYEITASSYIGGSADNDSVRGCDIQSDGTVVLAANIGDATPGGLTPILLNGATNSSSGAILRLSPDGTTVLSVTRLADLVLDLVVDDSDNIYVALWTQGMAKLDPTAASILWQKEEGNVNRIDAGPTGHCTTLVVTESDPDNYQDVVHPSIASIRVYDPKGSELGNFYEHRMMYDVCIDEATQTIVHLGWRQDWDWANGEPVQIAYVQGRTYTGDVLWTAYDWSVDPNSDRYLNRSANNMADTRGCRCSIGRDGKLYCSFISQGGNHQFFYDPFDIMRRVEMVGGDEWLALWNTSIEHDTVFARYEPRTGEYLLGQQFTCRLPNTAGNTVTTVRGEIRADELGRVYVGGMSGWGLPIPGHPMYSCQPGQIAFNPFDGYVGGAFFVVFSPDFKTRLYCTRLTATGGRYYLFNDHTHAIAARVLSDGLAHIAFGGSSVSEVYPKAAIQENLQGAQDGWFAVIPPSEAPSTLYVDDDASGKNNGRSWVDAFNSLQDALCAAKSILDVNEVRVAQGIYRPDRGYRADTFRLPTRGDRSATFQLLNGVAIRGGYAGFGAADPDARDMQMYTTILSGDLDGDDIDVNDPCDLATEPTRTTNSRHVVTGSGTDATAILDGFTIIGGYANEWPQFGGGMYNEHGSPTVSNCIFSGNWAERGGGIANEDFSSPRVVDCVFRANGAGAGAGVSAGGSAKPSLSGCMFIDNSASGGAGGSTIQTQAVLS